MNQEFLRHNFDMYDLDRNGCITLDELYQLYGKLGLRADPGTLEYLMAKYDKNGDGMINFSEFCDMIDFRPKPSVVCYPRPAPPCFASQTPVFDSFQITQTTTFTPIHQSGLAPISNEIIPNTCQQNLGANGFTPLDQGCNYPPIPNQFPTYQPMATYVGPTNDAPNLQIPVPPPDLQNTPEIPYRNFNPFEVLGPPISRPPTPMNFQPIAPLMTSLANNRTQVQKSQTMKPQLSRQTTSESTSTTDLFSSQWQPPSSSQMVTQIPKPGKPPHRLAHKTGDDDKTITEESHTGKSTDRKPQGFAMPSAASHMRAPPYRRTKTDANDEQQTVKKNEAGAFSKVVQDMLRDEDSKTDRF